MEFIKHTQIHRLKGMNRSFYIRSQMFSIKQKKEKIKWDRKKSGIADMPDERLCIRYRFFIV